MPTIATNSSILVRGGGVPLMPLGDVLFMKAGASISAGNISDLLTETQAVSCYGGNGIRGYVSNANQETDAVLVGRQGALCGNVQFAVAPFYATEHAVVIRPKGEMNLRYLYHALAFADLSQYKTSGAQPGLSVKRLKRVQIPVPSLEEQEHIVSILDKFDTLVNNISQGLPAEIEARRKQYEYYRDKLLTFKEKAA
ncbi:restriction endonuclease subunit S [Adlercreutzia mucosicola]|uniref:restriction endonuclease subunit S n=2 Tax=Adlercreutzia mucosicola TaxID=580026 RepID=UPI000A032B2C|nr:restriction endonuclease subunit S [Adlercreutzia mucosicola]